MGAAAEDMRFPAGDMAKALMMPETSTDYAHLILRCYICRADVPRRRRDVCYNTRYNT
jgi:hypothetical protein